MELNKKQFKKLLENINWEISDIQRELSEHRLKEILDNSLIDYEK